ncbi:MAG: M20/M25/M40 family metallo-hydrolase [Bacteroidia bacterium]|nr:M20/M25/M40 family metallo-hydrolase [Bacteroidia bacterium]
MKLFLRFSLFVLTMMVLGLGTFAQELDDGPMGPIKSEPFENPDNYYRRTLNPVIEACVNEVNPDSIQVNLQHLQDYGSRFLLLDNRKEIAEWIAGKFQSYGYTDVVLDSFLCYINWGGIFIDTLWEYNIVATLTGQSAPDEIYIVGGHYDAIVLATPDTAPGADDNGSGTVATMEIARVMKKMDFQPEATIKFCLFAAEELGLFGSRFLAERSREEGEDIRYMLNMDMIANNPDSVNLIKIYEYVLFEWAAQVAASAFEAYTGLEVVIPGNNLNQGSDSFPYWLNGYPSIFVQEFDFSPHYHSHNDVVANCNINYCAEVTKGACATLMDQQFLPYPQGLLATSTTNHIEVSWKPTENTLVDGFNIFRSATLNGGYEKINQALIADTFYVDVPAETGVEYYYYVTIVNNLGDESMPSARVWGARFGFTDTLLVVSSLNQSDLTPDSIYQFYASILDTIPFTWFDLNATNSLDLGTLARHQNVLWLQNGFNAANPTDTLGFNLYTFFMNGGNMFVSGFLPSHYWANNTSYPSHFPETYFISQIFKIDSVDRRINSFMFQAYPSADDFDTLRVDPAKNLTPELPGELFNIEVFAPTSEGKVIYRFNSQYPPTSNQGKMQDRPVAIEYMGDDFKTIFMSFPLYYIDTNDARNLLKYVMKYKFSHPTGIPSATQPADVTLFQNYPNPFSGETTIPFMVDKPTHVNLSVYSLKGIRVAELVNTKLESGYYTINFSSSRLPSGLYQVVLQTDRSLYTRKIVLIR